jgi:hypothetical protein
MNDQIDILAAEYWAHYLEVEPTHAHLIGDYSGAARFEEATRESEDREIAAMRDFAQRAEAIDEAGLDDQHRPRDEQLRSSSTTG